MCNDYDFPDPADSAPILWDELFANQPASTITDPDDEPLITPDESSRGRSQTNNDLGFNRWQTCIDYVLTDITQLSLEDLDEYDLQQAFVDGATISEAAASIFASDKLANITMSEDDIKARFGVDKLFIYPCAGRG